jgi:hypothetical protein
LIVAAPASWASASVAYVPSDRLMNRLAKSTPPIIMPIGGISTSLTNDDTILPNAPPRTMPIAMSTTLPRMAKSLNSFSMGFPPGLRRPGRRRADPRLRVRS